MRKITTIIVDDEPLARERIARHLRNHPDLEVVAEAGDGDTALALVAELEPDLLLLDIQMPELDGVAVAKRIDEGEGPRPEVIFLTAYDEYALEAFEAAVVDYVLKPVDPARLSIALDRVRRRLSSSLEGSADDALTRLLERWDDREGRPLRFVVRKTRGRRVVVDASEIRWVGAERNYVRLYTSSARHLHRETMNRMAELLDSDEFVRIHRSTIVRISEIGEIDAEGDGNIFIRTRAGERLSVGDSYREALESALGHPLR